jgi:hypothetical protein
MPGMNCFSPDVADSTKLCGLRGEVWVSEFPLRHLVVVGHRRDT